MKVGPVKAKGGRGKSAHANRGNPLAAGSQKIEPFNGFTDRGDLIEHPQRLEHAGRIWPKAHASAHFSEGRRPLVDGKRKPGSVQGKRSCHSANSAAGDDHASIHEEQVNAPLRRGSSPGANVERKFPVEIGASKTWRHDESAVVPLLSTPLKHGVYIFMDRKGRHGDQHVPCSTQR